jgi:hypothetical protein
MNDSYQVNYLGSTYLFWTQRGFISVSWTVADSTNNIIYLISTESLDSHSQIEITRADPALEDNESADSNCNNGEQERFNKRERQTTDYVNKLELRKLGAEGDETPAGISRTLTVD